MRKAYLRAIGFARANKEDVKLPLSYRSLSEACDNTRVCSKIIDSLDSATYVG